MKAGSKIVVISQVFVPDPAALGQYLADGCEELVRRGWQVQVYTANHGYDDSLQQYPGRENIRGVEVIRLPLSSTGKRNLLTRSVGMLSFLIQAAVRTLFLRNVSAILVSTSPPFAPIVASVVAYLKRTPLIFWAMDLNPDQATAAGLVSENSAIVRLFRATNRWVLRRAGLTITLDGDMARRLRTTAQIPVSLVVHPLWPLHTGGGKTHFQGKALRQSFPPETQLVLLYSGNHSPVHPLDTVIDSAVRLKADLRFGFAFIGGGKGKPHLEQAVQRHGLKNVVTGESLRLEEVEAMLLEGDIHLISFGEAMVGCVHPSKFYAALSVGRPIILIGPRQCYIADFFAHYDCGWRVDHGDVDGMIGLLKRLTTDDGKKEIQIKAKEAHRAVRESHSTKKLRDGWADLVETALKAPV